MKIDPRIAMTLRQIMLMNFGFFGIQYSFGLQQTAITPVFSFLNADPAPFRFCTWQAPLPA
jgi:maltose/moltooligosaccharide transporter